MSLKTEWVRYGKNREYFAYLAQEEKAETPLPALVILQEAFGVDAHIEDVTRRFAQAGYVAVAPDLFAQNGKRHEKLTVERMRELVGFMNQIPLVAWHDVKVREAELAKLPKADGDRINETMQTMFSVVSKPDEALPAVLSTVSWLREEYPATRDQKIATLGFCFGGSLSGRVACLDPQLTGAVIFYGNPPPAEMISQCRCPVIGFYGGVDKRITDQIPSFSEAMKAKGKTFEPHIYEGAPHAFFNETRPLYHVAAARDSFARALEWCRKTLGH